MLEIFVDSQYHNGRTIYCADDWTLAGKTRGYKRIYGGNSESPTESLKWVFLKPLHRDARRILCAPQLPYAYRIGVEKMKLNPKDYHCLLEFFDSLDDFRSAQGKRHNLASVLALIAQTGKFRLEVN